jgi:hypothetical protein
VAISSYWLNLSPWRLSASAAATATYLKPIRVQQHGRQFAAAFTVSVRPDYRQSESESCV